MIKKGIEAVTSRGTLKMLPSKEPPQEKPSDKSQKSQMFPRVMDKNSKESLERLAMEKPRRMRLRELTGHLKRILDLSPSPLEGSIPPQ